MQVGRRAGALKTRGIGGILDYAAEVDLRPAEERAERDAKKKAAGDDRLLLEVRCCWCCCRYDRLLLKVRCCCYRSERLQLLEVRCCRQR